MLLDSDSEQRESESQEYGVDALTKAYGKPDVRGRVKVFGSGYRLAYGTRNRSESRSPSRADAEKIRAEITRELEVKFQAQLKEEVANEVQKAIAALLQSGKLPFTQTAASTPTTSISERPVANRVVEKPTPCFLAVVEPTTGNQDVVADGMVYPPIGNQKTLDGHYTVSIVKPLPGFEHVLLPVPSEDGVTKEVGAAVGHFLDWPADLVIWKDESSKEVVPSAVASFDPCSATSATLNKASRIEQQSRPMLTSEQRDALGEESKMLHDLLESVPNPTEYERAIVLRAPFLYYKEDGTILVARSDIEELLKGHCLNVSL